MSEELFRLRPWSPEAYVVAETLIDKIRSAVPELEVLFMGALALRLPGKNDIDLDVLCPREDIEAYTTKLVPILGEPTKRTPELSVWNMLIGTFEVDAILSDPLTSHVPDQRHVFGALKASPALLAEYKKLKEESAGRPYEVYELRKKQFFADRILDAK